MKASTKSLAISSLFVMLIVAVFCFQFVIPAKGKTGNTPVNQSFDKLPPGLAPAVAKALNENLPDSYKIKKSGKTFKTKNESHGMRYAFAANGPIVKGYDNSWKWGMALKRWGYEGELKPVPSAEPTINKDRVEYKRGQTLTEWYKNTAFGLEQGFTVANQPITPKTKDSQLTLEIAISGTLIPKLKEKTLLLQNKKGETLSRYTGLYAYDINHQALPARLVLADNTLNILVDDTKATYPITIDPWVQRAKLTASDGDSADYFGRSVAVYGDTVVIGASGDYTQIPSVKTGSAYVFVKPANGWSSTSTSATKLLASDGGGDDRFGFSVDIYYKTIVVGAYTHDTGAGETDAGAAYVFENPGSSWSDAGETTTETIKLTASTGDRNVGDNFGYSVAVATDVIVVGAWKDDHESATVKNWGAAYVFKKVPKSSWTTGYLSTKLVESNPTVNMDDWNHFGTSVDVKSSLGKVAVVGASGEYNSRGVAYVFVEPALGGWSGATTTETAKLTSSDYSGGNGDWFGQAVAISSDTVLIGASGHYGYCIDGFYDDIGAAYVFEKPETGWADMTTETAKLTAGDCAYLQYFGTSVSIDQDTIVIGATGDNSNTGAAYVFKKPESGWTNMTNTFKVTARDGETSDYFGDSVSINGDTILVGAKDAGNGAAYIFEPGSAAMPWMIPLLLD